MFHNVLASAVCLQVPGRYLEGSTVEVLSSQSLLSFPVPEARHRRGSERAGAFSDLLGLASPKLPKP